MSITRGFWHHASDLDHADWLNGPEAICEDRLPNLCRHGANLDASDCWKCIEELPATATETTEALMRAFVSALNKIEGGR